MYLSTGSGREILSDYRYTIGVVKPKMKDETQRHEVTKDTEGK